jgi:ascorbate-specific PTS system EIIC-type component UlaA
MYAAIGFLLVALGAGFLFGTVYSSGSAYGRCTPMSGLDFYAYLSTYGEENVALKQ